MCACMPLGGEFLSPVPTYCLIKLSIFILCSKSRFLLRVNSAISIFEHVQSK
jgi:hypothetical protein